ncbi:MAG: UvrD-helicase domain-containing protein [Chthoniobacterales bacterium]
MSEPSDHTDRCRFAEELDRNFSVVASAGSGKTHAITERVVRIAGSTNGREILPKLVVVTFTHRAADEMQQRTRQRILEEHRSEEVRAAFNRAFFGTIHSFCMKLLANYGHYLGLPTALELVTDDDDLWEEFVQGQTRIGRSLSDENRAALFRLAQARQLMELGRNARSVLAPASGIGSCPKVDFAEVHAAVPPTKSGDTIANSKAELADWEKRYNAGWDFVRWPVRTSSARDFLQRWRDAFAPLRTWVADAALCVAAEVQRDYRDFRLERGVVTYADQIALADELLQHPTAARRVREEKFRVILDEAQDTDPAQFSVLTEITRPPDATGRWLETQTPPPRPGHFCMVGDFQQSIYRDRADLDNYRAIHRALLKGDAADELKFSVTYRLDQRQVEFINETFREILNNREGQVEFVELQPRPEVLPGQVIRVSLEAGLLPAGEKLKDYQKAKIEADALAAWIKTTGLEKLRAHSWRDVAILCPRKLWLRMLATALRRVGLPAAIQSESDVKGDNPAHAWLTALCTIMSDPRNSYEVVGVLREVFGISDHDLALFAEGEGRRFRIDHESRATGIVSSPLRLLAETRVQMEGRSLFDALNILVEQTQLRQRLASLPPEDFPNLARELDALLALAAEAEANGATLSDFAVKLRADFLMQRDVRLSADEGIQLITAQKAKGSEWQAVILPFLGRGIIPPSPRYPCILKIPGSNEPLVALNKEDFPDEVRSATKVAVQQEMARLLYVAATRARHTLVLAHDRELFLNSKGAIPPTAQLKHFEADAKSHAAIFARIGTIAETCARTAEATLKAREQAEDLVSALRPIDRREQQQALRRAEEFVHKRNPSAYDPELALEEIETERAASPSVALHLRSAADSPATLYGRWWHSLLQNLEWRTGLPEADRIFQERQPRSPDNVRSAAEWKRVRGGLFNEATITRFLSAPTIRAHTEFPFSWSINSHAALEGVIDLLLIEDERKRCLLLDWKTNRVANGEDELLRARYRPQIAAYWKAVCEITGFEVAAGLFSTALGKLLMYDPAELKMEWARLEKLPPQRFENEMTPQDPW